MARGAKYDSTSTSTTGPDDLELSPSSPIPAKRSQRVHEEWRLWLEEHVQRPSEWLYQKYVLELLLRRIPLPPSKDGRHIPLHPKQPTLLLDERRGGHGYISNGIRSSRYTIWNFLPKQFLFQATRLHNVFFIAVGVPQTIPGLSTTGSFTTIVPLLVFMVLTILKEGYDDYRRHRLDKIENNRTATVVRERLAHDECASRGLMSHVRLVYEDAIHRLLKKRISTKEAVPISAETDLDSDYRWSTTRWCDIRVGDILRLERDQAVPADMVLLYATGENGVAYVETMGLDGETNLKSKQAPKPLQICSTLQGIRNCEADIVSEDPNRDLYGYNGRVAINDTTIPLTMNEVILRGSNLRNTTYAVGLVVNTGEECKVRTANHNQTAKKPRLERYSNQIVLALIVYVVLLSVGVSMGYLLWHDAVEVNSWYLQDAYVEFKQIIIGYLIMFNNVIPLALYISLEIVKIGQMLMIHSDKEMYDEKSNKPMICNTNTILENLGQVSYLLSDKTGTLTENVMKFQKASIAGLVWTMTAPSNADLPSEGQGHAPFVGDKAGLVVEELEVSSPKSPAISVTPAALSHRLSEERSVVSGLALEPSLTFEDMRRHINSHPESAFAQKARDYILGMALCHTALPETNVGFEVEFQASSPDELALVQAAKDLGYTLVDRSTTSISLSHCGSDGEETRQTFDILDVIEFSSKRKRMSIVLRCPDGRIWLLCKGADSVIVPRLRQSALASRKSHEVRRSIQVERDQRKSMSINISPTAVARPSINLQRKSSAMSIRLEPLRTTLEAPSSSPYQSKKRQHDCQLELLRDPAVVDDSHVFTRCFKHLDDFATEGLRTLLFSHKTLSEAEYSGWKKIYTEATTCLTDRQQHIEAAGEMIEQGLDLLGASAIEDKLQKGVPETIDKLRRANIKIWMLTGDKRETAINIAHSAQICKPDSDLFVLDAAKGDIEEQIRDVRMEISTSNIHSVIVIDGHTLGVVEEDHNLKQLFYTLIPLAGSVICCRASPAQKAAIVQAIRSRIPKALTLAIGDGANDVAMIQAAHVGVGISGQEGLQAARTSDYSIAQFRFLQRLLLVHGRWSYMRTARFILMTFWKEMFFYMMQALYQRYNGYTGTSLYENWSLTVLNTLFTSLCVIVPGIFEQDLKADTLLAVPELYLHGQCNSGLNLPDCLLRMLLATIQGMVVWYFAWAGFGHYTVRGDNGLFALGDLCFSLGIVWTNVSLLILETHYKTMIVGVSFVITVGGWWAWNGFMSGIYSDNLSPYDVKGGFAHSFGNDWKWWLTLLVTLAVLATLEAVHKGCRRHMVAVGMWPPWKRKLGYNARDLDLGIWQEMEQDPGIAVKLKELAAIGYGETTTDTQAEPAQPKEEV